jgi:hypothetical protein
LATLLNADSPLYNEKTHAGLFYAESWALVHMLYLGPDYRSNLPALLAGIKSGARMTETFQRAYGKPVERVQKDLESYLQRRPSLRRSSTPSWLRRRMPPKSATRASSRRA